MTTWAKWLGAALAGLFLALLVGLAGSSAVGAGSATCGTTSTTSTGPTTTGTTTTGTTATTPTPTTKTSTATSVSGAATTQTSTCTTTTTKTTTTTWKLPTVPKATTTTPTKTTPKSSSSSDSTVSGPIWVVPPGVDPTTANRAYTIASAHWPSSRCAGDEQVGLAHESALRDLVGPNYATGPDIHLVAVAAAGTCRVLLNDEITWSGAMLCMIAEHEFGHLAGLGHSSDPDDVMAPIVRRAPDCEAGFGAPDAATAALMADAHADGATITDDMVGAATSSSKSAPAWGSSTVLKPKRKPCRTKVSKRASLKARKAAKRCRVLLAKKKALARKRALVKKRALQNAARP